MIAGLVSNKVIAPIVFNGSCNTKVFETWVEKVLIKELIPGQVAVDHASFHTSEKTKAFIASASCQLIFLPPYSPDLNPIKKFWANMKRCIKQKIPFFQGLYSAMTSFFKLS